MIPLIIVLILQAFVIVAMLSGICVRERTREQLKLDWNMDMIDLGIAWRYYVKSIPGEWNVDVKCRRRYIEQWLKP